MRAYVSFIVMAAVCSLSCLINHSFIYLASMPRTVTDPPRAQFLDRVGSLVPGQAASYHIPPAPVYGSQNVLGHDPHLYRLQHSGSSVVGKSWLCAQCWHCLAQPLTSLTAMPSSLAERVTSPHRGRSFLCNLTLVQVARALRRQNTSARCAQSTQHGGDGIWVPQCVDWQ